MYYPVRVPGALFSAADAHAAQGDSECDGTAIESSWTGLFKITLRKNSTLNETNPLYDLNYPLLETPTEWIVHGFAFPDYFKTLDPDTYI